MTLQIIIFSFFIQLLLLALTCHGFSPSQLPLRQRATPLSVGSFSDFLKPKNKKDVVASGVDAALLLGDKKRQSVFKQDIGKQFPFIPPAVLDVCMDALSASFDNAPSDLKKALKPGGLDKVRPGIEAKVVKSLKTQQMIKDIPLPEDDKTKLLEYIVKMSMDYLLEDAQAALVAPAMKLQTLEREQYEIRRYMTFWQISWYRLRYFPVRTVGLAALSAWTMFLTFQYYKDTAVVSSLTSTAGSMCAIVGAIAKKVAKLVTAISK